MGDVNTDEIAGTSNAPWRIHRKNCSIKPMLCPVSRDRRGSFRRTPTPMVAALHHGSHRFCLRSPDGFVTFATKIEERYHGAIPTISESAKGGSYMKLAIPSIGEGGLDAQRSAHFGHADCFTIVTIEDGAVADVHVIANPPHAEGGCMRPVGILADHGIDAIVAAGMGMRPMQGFANAGITVLYDADAPLVGDVVQCAAAGELAAMGPEHACHH